MGTRADGAAAGFFCAWLVFIWTLIIPLHYFHANTVSKRLHGRLSIGSNSSAKVFCGTLFAGRTL